MPLLEKRPAVASRTGPEMTRFHFLPFLYAGAININCRCAINTRVAPVEPSPSFHKRLYAIIITLLSSYIYILFIIIIIETRNSVKSVVFIPTRQQYYTRLDTRRYILYAYM